MKVSRLLAAALVAFACARDSGPEQSDSAPENDITVAGTVGDDSTGPAATSSLTSEQASPAQDARAAADGPTAQAAERAGQNVPSAILEDFNKRIEQYEDIRKRAAREAPPLKETNDPAKIKSAQDSRAAAIRALRPGAKPGDIFTPAIRHTFRQLLAPPLEGDEGRDVKQVLRDDAPAPGAVPLEVNARYPESAPLPTVPATLLASLPQLPKGIEYRIIRKDLVLLDSDANLILDFIRNVIR